MVLVDWQVDIDSQFIQEPTKAIIQTKSKGTSHWNIESWCTNEGFGMYIEYESEGDFYLDNALVYSW